MYLTFERRNGPLYGYLFASSAPGRAGMHAGCSERWCVTGSRHVVTSFDSQPHPGSGCTPFAGYGMSPVKLSCDAAATYTCPPHDGLSNIEKVRSESANCCASAV